MILIRQLMWIVPLAIIILCTYLWKTRRDSIGRGIGAGFLASFIGGCIWTTIKRLLNVPKGFNYLDEYVLQNVLIFVVACGIGLAIIFAITKILSDEKINKQ